MHNKILIRFGELSIKGKNKMSFVRQLENNIKKLMNVYPVVLFDRMFLDYSDKNIAGLKNIFGIYSYSPVVAVKNNIEDIKKTALKIANLKKQKTFKIIAKRHWKKFEMTSGDLNTLLGNYILKKTNLSVDVKNPELKIELEIRRNETYIYTERLKGLGGYPAGINGRVIHLISGGIDSPVAAFELMKRGIHVDYLSFVSPPFTDDKTIKKVNKIIVFLNKYQGESRLYIINYADLMNNIGLIDKQPYKIILMRRSFYRMASIIAKNLNYLAIGNGENIGQVASQTLESINVVQEQSSLPILRPILTADKIDTINKAIKIGTYEISIEHAMETCELFAPKNPVIKPTIIAAYKLEKELENLIDLEKQAISNVVFKKIQ